MFTYDLKQLTRTLLSALWGDSTVTWGANTHSWGAQGETTSDAIYDNRE